MAVLNDWDRGQEVARMVALKRLFNFHNKF